MQDRLQPTDQPPSLVPPPETLEDAVALQLAFRLRPQPLPWRPPPDDAPPRRLSA